MSDEGGARSSQELETARLTYLTQLISQTGNKYIYYGNRILYFHLTLFVVFFSILLLLLGGLGFTGRLELSLMYTIGGLYIILSFMILLYGSFSHHAPAVNRPTTPLQDLSEKIMRLLNLRNNTPQNQVHQRFESNVEIIKRFELQNELFRYVSHLIKCGYEIRLLSKLYCILDRLLSEQNQKVLEKEQEEAFTILAKLSYKFNIHFPNIPSKARLEEILVQIFTENREIEDVSAILENDLRIIAKLWLRNSKSLVIGRKNKINMAFIYILLDLLLKNKSREQLYIQELHNQPFDVNTDVINDVFNEIFASHGLLVRTTSLGHSDKFEISANYGFRSLNIVNKQFEFTVIYLIIIVMAWKHLFSNSGTGANTTASYATNSTTAQ